MFFGERLQDKTEHEEVPPPPRIVTAHFGLFGQVERLAKMTCRWLNFAVDIALEADRGHGILHQRD